MKLVDVVGAYEMPDKAREQAEKARESLRKEEAKEERKKLDEQVQKKRQEKQVRNSDVVLVATVLSFRCVASCRGVAALDQARVQPCMRHNGGAVRCACRRRSRRD